jgi:hypothetical protein
MSDVVTGRSADAPDLFRTRTLALMIGIGILAFVAMLILGAFAPDLRSGRNGGGHALSNSATGYSGIVRLAAATGRHPIVLRNPRELESDDLLVVTPQGTAKGLAQLLEARYARPTLVVLPKWFTTPDNKHEGWVRRLGLGGEIDLPSQLDGLKLHTVRSGGRPLIRADAALPATIAFTAPRPLQLMRKPGIEPLITDDRGGIVLARFGDGPLYVLSDPDLLSNRGMKRIEQAAAALALLDWLNSTGASSIGFDVTLNGLGHSRSPLKLAFEPPFLAMTIALAAALLLAGLHAINRFGAPQRRTRAIAFGKAALVENAAAMIRKAGRETRMGWPYAAVIRERAVARFGVPPRLADEGVDAYLDGLAGSHRFSELAVEARDAEDRSALLAAARALHAWEREKSR